MARGRKPTLDGRLAASCAPALQFARIVADAFPPAPEHFGEVARDFYAAAVVCLGEARALSALDAPVIEMAARAYERWLALDERIAEETNASGCGETGDKGFLSGRAQARAAAAKEYRALIGELGFSPVQRIKTAGAQQADFLGQLLASEPEGTPRDAADPFSPNVVAFQGR